MPALPEHLGVLRRRDFRLLLSAQAVSIFGDRMVGVALAFAVLEVGGSTAEVGLVLACSSLPMVATVLGRAPACCSRGPRRCGRWRCSPR